MSARILTRRVSDTTTTWELVLDAIDDDAVADELTAWPPPGVAPMHGDLVRVVADDRDDTLVWDDARSALVRVPTPRGVASLVAWWEGDSADAREMLRACAPVDRRRLVLAACDCADTVQHRVPDGETRPRRALDTARAWARGEATAEQCRDAAADAFAASAYAASAYAADASAASAYAADASAYAADASAASAYAADASADAADASAASAYAADASAYAADATWNAAAAWAADATWNAAADATWNAAAAWAADATWNAAAAAAAAAASAAARRALAPLVRARIPLCVLACALVGARDPLPVVTP